MHTTTRPIAATGDHGHHDHLLRPCHQTPLDRSSRQWPSTVPRGRSPSIGLDLSSGVPTPSIRKPLLRDPVAQQELSMRRSGPILQTSHISYLLPSHLRRNRAGKPTRHWLPRWKRLERLQQVLTDYPSRSPRQSPTLQSDGEAMGSMGSIGPSDRSSSGHGAAPTKPPAQWDILAKLRRLTGW